MEKDELYKVLSDIRSKIQNELLTPIFDEFISNITSDDVLHITSKLIKYKCLKYTRKRDIMENCLTTIEKADKLFDFVYSSDIIVIYRFIEEVKVLLPHVYRIIETADEKLKSEYTSYVNFDVALNKIIIKKDASEKSENILTESNNNQIELLIEKIENLNTLVLEQSKTIKLLEEEIRSKYIVRIIEAPQIQTNKEKIESKRSSRNPFLMLKNIFVKRKSFSFVNHETKNIEPLYINASMNFIDSFSDDNRIYYGYDPDILNIKNKSIKEIDTDTCHYYNLDYVEDVLSSTNF